MGEPRKLVTIVNKNYPPGPGITGESANDLAGWLLQMGVMVNVVHSDGQYSGGGAAAVPNGKGFVVKSLYDGKNKLIRLFSSFIEGFLLVKRARKVGAGGLIIVMTDPPFLILWASILLKRNKWAYWSMDLYPDAFAAGKLVSKENYLYRLFESVVKKVPPNYIIALGTHQLQYILKGYKKEIEATILPCGVSHVVSEQEVPDWRLTEKIILGYCGNIGEAHSADFVVSLINSFDDEKFCLVVSVYGAKAEEVKKAALDRPGVTVKDRIPRSQLSYIDVHLVTLLPEWNNICVPSKAVSAVCEGGAIVFCGDMQNDNWEYLHDAGWLVQYNLNLKENIKNTLDQISKRSIAEKKKSAELIAKSLQGAKNKAYEDIYSFVSNIQLPESI